MIHLGVDAGAKIRRKGLSNSLSAASIWAKKRQDNWTKNDGINWALNLARNWRERGKAAAQRQSVHNSKSDGEEELQQQGRFCGGVNWPNFTAKSR